ncbi:MAG: iron-containing redox enzyme family protein [Comamonadaceae bacterium]|nr:iron-containing redox enzyme family protein [Comamonadaceae bacterium]
MPTPLERRSESSRLLDSALSHSALATELFVHNEKNFESLYQRLANEIPRQAHRYAAAEFLRQSLIEVEKAADHLPERPEDLLAWMETNVESVHQQYQDYLQGRKRGGGRRYFSNYAHALYVLRHIAPTKLVDGAWLYGLCAHKSNQRLSDLVTTYVEELGGGAEDKNHVKLYRELLARYGLDPIDGLDDELYHQGLIQLALGWNADEFFPEIVGFNLAYEQLPLHLLITAYELNELGVDPYYFTLHVTVDNADTGHAKRACVAALEAAPRIDDGGEYWRRVRAGAKLGDLGVSTLEVIKNFNIEEEVIRIFKRKAPAGHGAHSNFCKVDGRNINDWLSDPEELPDFVAALERTGWIKKDQPVSSSRFWGILQGERAEMYGVFSPYELQVIHDWIRGSASADGLPYQAESISVSSTRQLSFRVAERLKALQGSRPVADTASLDVDLETFKKRFPHLDPSAQFELLVQAMAPAMHWTPAGLLATQLFVKTP